jgi:hypothetical protein
MAFANHYLLKYAYKHNFALNLPLQNLDACIVIPSYEEPDIFPTLNSLFKAALQTKKILYVFVVINAPEDASESTLDTNRISYTQILAFNLQHKAENLSIYALMPPLLAKKFAGAGYARKIGMDLAVECFNTINQPNGLIINLDADSVVDENYFTAIFSHFQQNRQHLAANIYFEHPLHGSDFSLAQYQLMYNYELHLRYYSQMLKYSGFPFYFHTLGSAFVVKAFAYVKQNGMNRRKAGEDFYFLHKLTALGDLGNITQTTVMPSPRVSHRVPFGTGAFIREHSLNNDYDVLTYNPAIFVALKVLFKQVSGFYAVSDCSGFLASLNLTGFLEIFLHENNFCLEIGRIKQNVSNENLFIKQFFQWFNGFKMVKYCNFSTDFLPKIRVEQAALFLVPKTACENLDLLVFYRGLDKEEV